jgi:hypothetical protein
MLFLPIAWRVAAVAIMIKIDIKFENIAPEYTSTRSDPYRTRSPPLSTTELCWKSCMYGVIVVPMRPTRRKM